MKLASLNVDSKGESYFAEIDTNNPSNTHYREMDVAYWQIWVTKPGHFADFKPRRWRPGTKCSSRTGVIPR